MIVATMGLALVVHNTPIYAEAIHEAKEGDTFFKLSQQYDVNLNDLMKANPNIEATNIYEGLKLTIPTAEKNTLSTNSVSSSSILNVIPEEKVVQAWGKTFTYNKTLNVKASAYSASASENGKWGAVDYFGNPLKLGTIAVDPKVIPLGTKVLVTGHDHDGLPKEAFVATATDAGSAIKGNRIDIFIPGSKQSVSKFGYQEVELFFIE